MNIRRAKRRLPLLVAIILTLSFTPAAPALADDPYYANGQETPRPEIYPFSYNDTWNRGLNQAITNWNATWSPVAISKTTTTGSSITVKSYTASWLGLYQSCSPYNCVYIYMNSRTISAEATNKANFITSVAVHEFGHSFKLAHRDGQYSIMNRDRNRDTMVAPSNSDVANVKAFYPGWPIQ